MGGDSSFLAMLRVVGFLSATWLASKASHTVGISSIVLEITTGVILGPAIVGLIPEQYAECEHARYTYCDEPDGFEDGLGALSEHLAEVAATDACDKEAYVGCFHQGHHDDAGDQDLVMFDFDVAGLPFSELAANATRLQALTDGVAEALAVSLELAVGVMNVSFHDDSGLVLQVEIRQADEQQALELKTRIEQAKATLIEAVRDALSESSGSSVTIESVHFGWTDTGDRRRMSGSDCGDLDYDSYGDCLVAECEVEIASRCQKTPDIFTLIGHTGVAMMIFESGMHFDFEMAKTVGPRACVVAVVGTILPLASGMGLSIAFGKDVMPDGLTAGTALAPTSVGIALRLLSEAEVLHRDFGQSIMTAAFVDDILSLVLFNIIFSIGDGHFSFMGTFFWSIMGILFMIFAVVLAVKFWPKVLQNVILPRVERYFEGSHGEQDDSHMPADLANQAPAIRHKKPTKREEALFLMMLLMLCGYAAITYVCGTHLWGCFIAGMSFACMESSHPHLVWSRQTKRMTSWMIRIFFSCTVAFSIPVEELISLSALWKGAIMGIGPCILAKVCCAFFMGKARFVIGWAMVGRAEFAYLIAQMGLAGNLLDQELFSIVIWALLWATIVAPLVFRVVLNRYILQNGVDTGKDPSATPQVASGDKDPEPNVDV